MNETPATVRFYKAYDIKYDTGGAKGARDSTPDALYIMALDDGSFDPAYELSDMISDCTGWCIEGFKFEEVSEKEYREHGGQM